MTVRISRDTAHEPDALVHCGPKLPADAFEVPNPVVVVEVSSPSSRKIDAALKVKTYFSLPSVHHYLIVDPDEPRHLHHQRQTNGMILTRIFGEGISRLDPPGMEISVDGSVS